ncbi:MAG TPA: hypothetical protein VN922_24040 [Bacteroidia bacterium]|nr:hypothetical protein [Bacteroidia bacterium]
MKKIIITYILSIHFAITAFAQQKPPVANLPGTEIYLINIQQKGNSFSLADTTKPLDISNNKGYDNQPVFIEKLNAIAYVSSRENKPTDVYLYDLTTKKTKQFTNNDEAEYSPKLTPSGKFISVVKGPEQNLTRIALDGTQTMKIYTCKDSIGYYCWIDSNKIAAVVLTNPISLKLIDTRHGTETYLMDSIGRSLFKYDKGIVLCQMRHNGNWVAYLDVTTKPKREHDVKNRQYQPIFQEGCVDWIQLPAGTEDFYTTEDGWIFSSNGSRIVYCNVKELNKGWQILADLKSMGISKIFRLAVNKNKSKLAFVTEKK